MLVDDGTRQIIDTGGSADLVNTIYIVNTIVVILRAVCLTRWHLRYCYRSSVNSSHTIYANDLNLKITYVFDTIYDTKDKVRKGKLSSNYCAS